MKHRDEDTGPEPFGQAGVRQYFGKWVAWLCVVGALLTAAMWYRSTFFFDIMEWRGKGQWMHVRSMQERLIIDYGARENAAASPFNGSAGSGWSYHSGYMKRFPDGWQDSLWKTIGVEFGAEPLDRNASSGFWLRIKWQLIVMIMILVPTTRGIYVVYRRHREAEE